MDLARGLLALFCNYEVSLVELPAWGGYCIILTMVMLHDYLPTRA